MDFTVSLRPEIMLLSEGENFILQSPLRKLTFHSPKSGLKAALNYLKNSNQTVTQLQQLVRETDGTEVCNKFAAYLQRLTNLGWICHSVPSLATAIPMAGNYQFNTSEIDWQEMAFTLSRFAYLHQVDGQMILESPRSQAKIVLHSWQATALIAQVSQTQTISTLIAGISGFTETSFKQFLSLLLATKMLSSQSSSGDSDRAKPENSPLIYWEFHDLLFHSRSCVGRHDNPVGGTYRFADKIAPLPGVKPPMSERGIPLYRPDLKELAQTDISLTQALELRQSIRQYDESPITAQSLGELLYRCARVKEMRNTKFGQFSRRPYPSGGAVYELEIYPVINQCEGLDSGLYQYHPSTHQLYGISDYTHAVETLIAEAWNSSGQQDKPQILLIITARFGRLFWKYQGLGYALLLKNVGVLYQTLYLVATSMNLAPCALGTGNSDLFAQASGINYYEESAVGEFMLGSVPI